MKDQVWYLDDGTTRPAPDAVTEDVGYCVRLRRNGDFLNLFVFVLSDMPKNHKDHTAGDDLFAAYVVGGSADQAITTAQARLMDWIAAGKWPE